MKKKLVQKPSITKPISPTMEKPRWWMIAAIVFVGFLAYSNVYHNTFLYDDEHYVVRNPYVRDFSHLKEIFTQNVGAGVHRPDNFYRPMQIFLYTVVYQVSGLSTTAYHLLNLLLHFSNAVMIYLFLIWLAFDPLVAFGVGVLYAVHPVHTEAVTYMNGTADPLAAFWMLLGLLVYLKMASRKWRMLLVGLCGALALLSKETAIIFPLLLMATDFYLKREQTRWKEWIFPWVIGAVYMGLRFTVFNFTRSLNLFSESNIYTENLHYRIFTFLASLKTYATVLSWPADLRYDRGLIVFTSLFSQPVLIGFALLVGIFWLMRRSWDTNRIYFLAGALFLIPLGPVSGLLPINGFAMEHWLYVPCVGFLLGGVYLLRQKIQSRSVFLLMIFVAALGLGARTWKRNQDWKDPIRFYSDTLRHNPRIARVHNNLAMAYAERGEDDAAIQHYLQAIGIEDVYAETHYNLGQIYLKQGRISEAVAAYERSLQINPQFVYSHARLAEIFSRLGRSRQSQEHTRILQSLLAPK